MKPKQQIEHGKLPPQALDVEEVVLGALLLESQAMDDVIDILTVNSFYKESHQIIFQALLNLSAKSIVIDILTVTQELKRLDKLTEIGGAYFVSQLTNKVASAANIETHARIIEQKFIQREIIRHSSELVTDAFNETIDVFDLTDRFLTKAYEINNFNDVGMVKSNSQLLREVINNIEIAKDKQGLTGLSTGINKVDEVTGGYQNTDLIIKAGRPAMGKTAHAICEAVHMAYFINKKVLFFSLEMSAVQLMQRVTSIVTNFPINKFKNGDMDMVEWKHFHLATNIINDNLTIYDKIFTLNGIRKEARKASLKNKCDIIFIDYLQLIDAAEKGVNREQEVSKISRSLKLLAKNLNVPIVCLSQLSRAVEIRGGAKKPMLSDLRDSGSIEQDADMVQFLFRPEYYGISETDTGESTNGLAYLIIAKYRNGDTKDIPMRFIASQTKFTNFSNDIEPIRNDSLKPNTNFYETEKADDLPF